MTDEQLLNRLKQGDEEALIELHHRYVNLVFSMAYQVLGDGAATEEVTQDVFMKVWEQPDRYDPAKGRFTSWLLTVTRHAAIDRLRKIGRRQPEQGVASLEEMEWGIADDILDKAHAVEQFHGLRAALLELPPEQRAAVTLAYFGGLSQSEIADHLDIPLGTVKTRMRLAMDKLRIALVLPEEDA